MRFCRNFCTPKSNFLGRDGQNVFRTAPKGLQSPRKKFLMPPNLFWDYVGLSESKNAEIRPKNAILQKFLHPQNRHFGGGVVEIFSARTKRVPKVSKKFLVVPNSCLGSTGLSEPKIADFRPKNRNF